MRSLYALIQREFIEHKGAFFIAPATLLALITLLSIAGLFFGRHSFAVVASDTPDATMLLGMALAVVTAAWTAYLMVALFFYFADSFSADRRNNALLFWKSMPQSDFKILGAKALSGVTIFPALIVGFALITGVIVYVLGLIAAARLPFIPVAGPVEMISLWVQYGIGAIIFMLISILWYAPFLALVAGLSTLVQRWSIPLALLIPGLVVLLEYLYLGGLTGGSRPIAAYLEYRGDGFFGDDEVAQAFVSGAFGRPLELLGSILMSVDWFNLVLGLIFAVAVVYAASEYRRRRIDA